jgi:hypothetical protein
MMNPYPQVCCASGLEKSVANLLDIAALPDQSQIQWQCFHCPEWQKEWNHFASEMGGRI